MKKGKLLYLAVIASLLGGSNVGEAVAITSVPYANAAASGEYTSNIGGTYSATGRQIYINLNSVSTNTTFNYSGNIVFNNTSGGNTGNGLFYLTASDGQSLNATIASGATATTEGDNSDGIWIVGQNANLINNGTVTIKKDGTGAAYDMDFGFVQAGGAHAINNGIINVEGGTGVTSANSCTLLGYNVSGFTNVNAPDQFINNGTLNAIGGLTHGVTANKGYYENGAINNGTINVTGNGSGMITYGTNNKKIYFTNAGTINVEKGKGIDLQTAAANRGTIALKNGSTIKTTGTGATSLATGPIGVNATYTDITSDGTSSITTVGAFGAGINIVNSTLNVNSGTLSIATSGGGINSQNSADGINLTTSEATVKSGATLNIATNNASTLAAGGTDNGIWLSGSKFTNNGELNVVTKSQCGEGFEIDDTSEVNFNGKTSVVSSDAWAMCETKNSKINMNSSEGVYLESNTVGLKIGYGGNGASVNATDNNKLTIKINGAGDAINASETGTTVDINGDLSVMTDNGTAINLGDGNPVVNVNQSGAGVVKVAGDVLGTGATAGAVANVKMTTADSYLTGKTDKGVQEINFDLANGAAWNVTADSNLTKITNNAAGVVNMQQSGTNNYETVTTEDYVGNGGDVRFDTDLNSETDGDKFVINAATGAAAGNIQVYDKSLGLGTEVVGEKQLLLVVDPSGNTTWTGKALDTGGLWDVTPTVERGDSFGLGDTNWYLRKFALTLNNRTTDLFGTFDAAYGTWRSSLTDDTLRKRLGDLRNVIEPSGIWARVKAGKLSNSLYDSSYQMFQVGYDKKVGKDTYYGIAVDHTKTSNTYGTGTGEGSMTDVSLYATSYHPSGAYSDVVLRAGKVRNSMNSYSTTPDSLDYDTWAYSVGYEVGKTYINQNGWFIEPEGQLTYGVMRGGNYATDSNVQLNSDTTKSLLGRLGFVVGRKVNAINDYYFKANVYREFTGERALDITSTNNYGFTEAGSFSQGHKDTWFEIGVGGNLLLSKKTYLYGDIEKSFGSDIEKKWQANAGVRWEF